jgi:hypothetical protein
MSAKLTMALMLSIAAAAGAQAQSASTRERLLGSWTLVKWEVFDPNGGAIRPGAYDVGHLTYDRSGEMSAHLMRTGQPKVNPATDAERSAAYRSYLGYFGPFTVDDAKGVVVHHVRGSSNPSWPGTDQVRHFSLLADGRLTLSLKNGERITQTLTWEKVR